MNICVKVVEGKVHFWPNQYQYAWTLAQCDRIHAMMWYDGKKTKAYPIEDAKAFISPTAYERIIRQEQGFCRVDDATAERIFGVKP